MTEFEEFRYSSITVHIQLFYIDPNSRDANTLLNVISLEIEHCYNPMLPSLELRIHYKVSP